jgi:hypothetical protein
VCHTRNKRVVVVDSFHNTDTERTREVWPAFFHACIQPLQRHFGQEQDQLHNWSIEVSRRSSLQSDTHSCGLHMLSTLRDVVVRGYIPFATFPWGHLEGVVDMRRGCWQLSEASLDLLLVQPDIAGRGLLTRHELQTKVRAMLAQPNAPPLRREHET